MTENSSLGDRMKAYEAAHRIVLPRRMPVIIRVDGKGFHRWTRHCARPFDSNLIEVMNIAAVELCEEVQGTRLAYVQSDEISLLVHGYETHESQPWFDNQLQKIVSVAAAIAKTTRAVILDLLMRYTPLDDFPVPVGCWVYRSGVPMVITAFRRLGPERTNADIDLALSQGDFRSFLRCSGCDPERELKEAAATWPNGAELFNLAPGTVAAWRAHRTRGTYDKRA